MVLAPKEKVLLLVDYFSGHWIANVASQLRVTRLEFLLPNTTSRFQPMDAGIIASFKAQYRKLMIRYQIDCLTANTVFAIDVYQAVTMVVKAWHIGVTSSTIVNCWRHTGVLSSLSDRERDDLQRERDLHLGLLQRLMKLVVCFISFHYYLQTQKIMMLWMLMSS